jgi:hypothetical protein
MIDGTSHWGWKQDEPVKTLWVLLRTSQRLLITGRRFDGLEMLKFNRSGDPPTEEFLIDDLAKRSVKPGGASPEIMQTYSFIPSLVFYPSPGCWEFTVRIGDAEHRIVRDVKPRQ